MLYRRIYKSDSVRNICFVQKDYLTLLIQNKLIEFVREEKMFRITDGGINALNIFDEMDKLLPLQFTDH
jgi:predicted transcriptional regulator